MGFTFFSIWIILVGLSDLAFTPNKLSAPLPLEIFGEVTPAAAGPLSEGSLLMGCIYLVTNKINGKQYVGKGLHGIGPRRYRHHSKARNGSKAAFHCALRKYGFDSFTWEEVDSNVPEEDLNRLETEDIAFFNSMVPNGYSMTVGGDGGDFLSSLSEERLRQYKEDHSRIMKRVLESPIIREKIRRASRRPCSSDKAAKISKALMGHLFSEESRAKSSKSHFGKKMGPLSLAHRKSLSVSANKRKPWLNQIRHNGKYVRGKKNGKTDTGYFVL